MSQLADIIGNYTEYVGRTIEKLGAVGIDINGMEIDHLCFRSSSLSQYLEMKEKLTASGCSLIIESMIGGRPISILTFPEPLICGPWEIRCLELASPKLGRLHHAGLEHIEVVIGNDKSQMFNSKPLLEEFVGNYPTVCFDKKAIQKEINADVSVDLGEGHSSKFHARPLYEVCQYEVENSLAILVPPGYFNVDV